MSTTGPRLSSPDADTEGWITVGPKGASLRLEGVEGVELRAASIVLRVASDDLTLTWLGQSRRAGGATVAQPAGFTLALASGDDSVATEWLTADWGELRALRGLTVKLTSAPKGEPFLVSDSEAEAARFSKSADAPAARAASEGERTLYVPEEAVEWASGSYDWAEESEVVRTVTPSRDCGLSLSVGGPWFPSGETGLKSGVANPLASLLASRAKIELLTDGKPSGARLAELTLRLSDQPESLALRGDGGTYGMKVGPTRPQRAGHPERPGLGGAHQPSSPRRRDPGAQPHRRAPRPSEAHLREPRRRACAPSAPARSRPARARPYRRESRSSPKIPSGSTP
jgi:hypothetical protein